MIAQHFSMLRVNGSSEVLIYVAHKCKETEILKQKSVANDANNEKFSINHKIC